MARRLCIWPLVSALSLVMGCDSHVVNEDKRGATMNNTKAQGPSSTDQEASASSNSNTESDSTSNKMNDPNSEATDEPSESNQDQNIEPMDTCDDGIPYGTDGTFKYDFGISESFRHQSRKLIQTPEGKTIVFGGASQGSSRGNVTLALVQLDCHGQLDSSFATQGVDLRTTDGDLIESWQDWVDLEISKNGDLFALTQTSAYEGVANTQGLTVARFNKNGESVDLFGDNGLLFVPGYYEPNTYFIDLLSSNALQLVEARQEFPNQPFQVKFLRFLPDGSTDLDFGTQGTANVQLPNNYRNSRLQDVVVDAIDRTYVMLRHSYEPGNHDWTIARFTANGELDLSFNATGYLEIESASDAWASVGNIYLTRENALILTLRERLRERSGSTSPINHGKLTKILENGMIDQDFAVAGFYTSSIGPVKAHIRPNGKILLGSQALSANAETPTMRLAQLNPNGGIDFSFGNGGYSSIEVEGLEVIRDLTTQSDGSILVLRPTNAFEVMQLNPSGTK